MKQLDRNGLWIDLALAIGLCLLGVVFGLLPYSIDYLIHHSVGLLGLLGLVLFGLMLYWRRYRL